MRRNLCAFAVLVLTACGGAPEPRAAGPDARAGLALGRQSAAVWLATSQADSVSAPAAIAVGYMERLRLGLGSPFRLIDYAARDPRLSDSARTALAWALLARTVDGEAYEIDAAALDRAGSATLPTWPGLGRHHLQIITQAVEGATDPRSGEHAVRLAYTLAAAEGGLPTHAPRYAANAAAIIRDRVLAREDAVVILRTADVNQMNALTLMQRWRSARRLQVEAPALTALSQESEREALAIAPRVTEQIRALSVKTADITSRRPSAVGVRPSLLSAAAASALRAQSEKMPMPAVAPLVVGARAYHQELVSPPWLSETQRARRRALESAGTEERFAANYALLERNSAYDVIPSLVALEGAVGMRAFAQEAVWYPGYPAPSTRELVQRYGLAGVTFGDDVPKSLRPYYRRMLDDGLRDLQRVLPSLDVQGLAVRIGEMGDDAGTLAMHDPRRRRLILPPATAAGTLAHEIAHDVDWQVAARRYNVQGDYASDRALRAGQTSDGFALRMHDLAAGTVVPSATAPRLLAHAKRPAEIFARNIDWFVTVALAGQGRSSGYLTSVQDEVITGYGTVKAPELTGVTADAMVTILDQIAPATPETRERFLRSYGSGRSLQSYDLARRVLEAEVPAAPRTSLSGTDADVAVIESIARARTLGESAIDAWTCRAPAGAHNAALERGRRDLVAEAAAARARGYAIRRAGEIMGKPAAAWMAGQLHGAPWISDGIPAEAQAYLMPLVDAARAVGAQPEIGEGTGFHLAGSATGCSGDGIAALR